MWNYWIAGESYLKNARYSREAHMTFNLQRSALLLAPLSWHRWSLKIKCRQFRAPRVFSVQPLGLCFGDELRIYYPLWGIAWRQWAFRVSACPRTTGSR